MEEEQQLCRALFGRDPEMGGVGRVCPACAAGCGGIGRGGGRAGRILELVGCRPPWRHPTAEIGERVLGRIL